MNYVGYNFKLLLQKVNKILSLTAMGSEALNENGRALRPSRTELAGLFTPKNFHFRISPTSITADRKECYFCIKHDLNQWLTRIPKPSPDWASSD